MARKKTRRVDAKTGLDGVDRGVVSGFEGFRCKRRGCI